MCFHLNCCKSAKPSEDMFPPEVKNKKHVRKKIRRPKSVAQKILLLGTGESGKSTFLKQMRIITGKTFTDNEMERFKSIIFDNIYNGVLYLLQARIILDIPWSGGVGCEAERAAEKLERHFQETKTRRRDHDLLGQDVQLWCAEEFLNLAPLFHSVWEDQSIQLAFDRRNRLITEDFSENTRYYLNRLSEIAIPNYYPTDEDIVWSRYPTDSIIEEDIQVHGNTITFIDVGGQTKERRKWCQTFTDMTSVLFLVASSHYDELYLDRVTSEYRNKLREAMTVFECLINLVAFRRASIILFFNKSDLLKEKILAGVSGIRAHFPEYPVNADEFELVDVQNFLVTSFASLVDPIVCPSVEEYNSSMRRNRLSGFRKNGTPLESEMYSTTSLNIKSTKRTLLSDLVPKKRTIYRHFTTAVNKKNIETVFNAMQDTILQNNLRRLLLN